MRHVVITGGAGFIGRALADHLLHRGERVTVVDDLRVEPLVEPVGDLRLIPVCDLTHDDLAGVDAVVHLAAYKSVPDSFERSLLYLDNVSSAEHLLELCSGGRVARVVVASTCEVYGRAPVIPTTEDTGLAPMSPYAASKVAVEMVARAHQAHADGTEVVVARLFNVFGPGEQPDAVIAAMCSSALRSGTCVIEGAGDQRRDFSYVDDTVRRLAALLDAPYAPVVNVGSGTSHEVREVVDVLMGLEPGLKVVGAPARRNEIHEFRACTAAFAALVDDPTVALPFEEGVMRTFEWWRRHLASDLVPTGTIPLPERTVTR